MPFLLSDTLDILKQLAAILLMLAVAWYVFKKAYAAGRILDALINLDRAKTMLLLTFFCLLIGIGSNVATIWLMANKTLSESVILAIGNFNGAILSSCVAMPVGYWFGTSDGSRAKDEAKTPDNKGA